MRERYKRQVVFLEDNITTAWADPVRRVVERPPLLWDIADDKCAEHTVDRVAKAIGLGWETTEKLRKEKTAATLLQTTSNTFWNTRHELARLDREADARYAAEDAEDADARAKRDALRDAAADERRSGAHR